MTRNGMSHYQKTLLCPARLYSKSDIKEIHNLVPEVPGVYAWYFKPLPPGVPTEGCVVFNDLTLLYVGMTKRGLRSRIWSDHFNGNAEGSTLRLSLGCLLSKKLNLRLEGRANGRTRTFGKRGESVLSTWLGKYGRFAWVRHHQPESVEKTIIHKVSVPLAIKCNKKHPFYRELKHIRKQHRDAALIIS